MRSSKTVVAWCVVWLVAGKSEAEAYPPPRCYAGWWLPSAEVPTTLEDLPEQPYVLLPLEWAMQYGGRDFLPPDSGALKDTHLLVEVRDAAGALVAGTLSLKEMPFTSSRPTHRPWWRPREPLEAGASYTMRVEVPGPPTYDNYDGCPWTAFEDSLELSVRSEPLELRAVVSSVRIEEVASSHGYGACGQGEAERRCDFPRSVCCPDPPRGRSFRIAATVEPMIGGAVYYLASYEVRSPYVSQDQSVFGLTLPLVPELGYTTRGSHGPLVPNEECARVTVTNLMDDTRLVSDWTCASIDDFRPTTAPRGCDPEMCRQAAGFVDVVEPGESERPGGCGGGGVVLWGVFVVGLWARRRVSLRVS